MSLIGFMQLWIIAQVSRLRANRHHLVGMEFDRYGRKLAARELFKTRGHSKAALNGLLNPVSCVRYFEFDCALRHIQTVHGIEGPTGKILDISSPRLFPFYLAQKFGAYIEMVNPDDKDLTRTFNARKYLSEDSNLEVTRGVDATDLPHQDESIDVVTSISVIEHVPDAGDSRMMTEIERVLKPGGYAVLSFPVKPEFENEFREMQYYGAQQADNETDNYFFQRYYDHDSIKARLLEPTNLNEVNRNYYCEHPVGWFEQYEIRWRKMGLAITVRDPLYMLEHFTDCGKEHPKDRMGICCILLKKPE